MTHFLFFTFPLFLSITSPAQTPLDSLVDCLQDKNQQSLDNQLNKLFSLEVLFSIDPDHSRLDSLKTLVIEKAAEKAKKFNQTGQVTTYAFLAEKLVAQKQPGLGYSMIKDALQKANTLPEIQQAYVFNKYSDIFKYLQRLDSSIFYAEKTIDIAQKYPNDSLEKSALDKLAILCYKANNFPKAEFYFKKLVYNPLSNSSQKKDYLNTIALTFRKRQQYDSALFYFKNALQWAEQLKDTAWMGLINGNIGHVFYLQKNYSASLPGLLLDVDYSFRINNLQSALNALSTLTSIYISQRNMRMAKIYYDSLANNIGRTENQEVHLEFYNTSSIYFENIGDFQKANQFLHSYLTLAYEIKDLENFTKAAELEAQYDFERQIRKIENLERLSQEQEFTNQQKNKFLIGTIFFIFLGSILTYLLYRSNRYKHRTNKILQEQNIRIKDQTKHLNQLNATKDKLFSIIGHDLRSPIHSLKALLEMVRKEIMTPEEFKQFSTQLQKNVEHVYFTLDNLLIWSSNQLQGIETHPQKTKLYDLVVEIQNLFSELLHEKEIIFKNKLSPKDIVMVDPNHIRLVFRNLISNAIKFTEHRGKINVSGYSQNDLLIISIHDNGIGMSSETLAHLFDQNTKTTPGTKGEKGTGLGLSLCKEMLEKNKGTLTAESIPGKGTTFRISLPHNH